MLIGDIYRGKKKTTSRSLRKAMGKKKAAAPQGKKQAKLREKSKQFCREYIVDLNPMKAYQKVYKCSYNTAKANAYRMLADVRIQAYISDLKQQSIERIQSETELEISADRVLQEVAQRAYTNMADFIAFNEEGQAELSLEGLSRILMAGVKKIKYTDLQPIKIVEMGVEIEREAIRTEIELHDNGRYLEMLMKHLGLLKEKIEVVGMNELVAALNAGRQRVHELNKARGLTQKSEKQL